MIIVIDGPAGSGKSSTAKAIAQRIGLTYIDSGALYRAVTLLYIQCNEDENELLKKLNTSKLRFDYKNNQFCIWVNEEDVTHQIRTISVNERVSIVAAMKPVRDYVNLYLRNVVKSGSFIADGRDLATVVFPEAELKIYMIASSAQRAKRRYDELIAMGQEADLTQIEDNLIKRDSIDSKRDEAPLRKDDHAVEIDTSNLTFEEQVNEIVSLIVNKGLN